MKDRTPNGKAGDKYCLAQAVYMKGVKKENLPDKICLTCNRPFTWRKKWEKNWNEVKYCSDRCRNKK